MVEVLMVAGALVVLAVGWRIGSARASRLRRFTTRHPGLYFTASDDTLPSRWFAFGGIFATPGKRQARNVIHGTWDGHEAHAFEFSYSSGAGQGGSNLSGMVIDAVTGLSSPSLDQGGGSQRQVAVTSLTGGRVFPRLSVTPENVAERVLGRMMMTDIELESEDFNRAFTVSCEDSRFATAMLTPQMMELLMRDPRQGVTFCGPSVMVVHDGHLDADMLLVTFEMLSRVIDLVPEHLAYDAGAPIELPQPLDDTPRDPYRLL